MTKETINKFKEKIYYQYNLINSFIFDYIEDINYNIINYMNLVYSKTNNSLISQKLNETTFSIYNELSNIINNKFDVLNYEYLQRRRLEWFWKYNSSQKIENNTLNWNLPFSFSINLFDFLRHCGIDLGDYNYTIFIDESFRINFKFEFTLIIGFEFGLNFNFAENDIKLDIDLYIEAGIAISAEFGYFKDFGKFEFLNAINKLLRLNKSITDINENLSLCSRFNKATNSTGVNASQTNFPEINFVSISLAVGVSCNIASVRVGIKYEYSTKGESHQLVIYYNFKLICIKMYLYFEFKFLDLFPLRWEFGFDLLCLYENEGNKTLIKKIPNLNAQ